MSFIPVLFARRAVMSINIKKIIILNQHYELKSTLMFLFSYKSNCFLFDLVFVFISKAQLLLFLPFICFFCLPLPANTAESPNEITTTKVAKNCILTVLEAF